MARICPLFSGSTGNATLIKDGERALLIDAGASFKSLCEAIADSGTDINNICGVLITHEHEDHIKGLKVLLNKLKIPVYASKETLCALEKAGKLTKDAEVFVAENDFCVNDFAVKRFATSHDTEGSSGYTVLLPSEKKVTVCTDLGVVTDEVRNAISGSDVLLFESNHDVAMLKRGPYPPALKLRILSDKGHLSNVACSSELPAFLKSGTTRFILGHLSLHNNFPQIALSAAKAELFSIGAKKDCDYILSAAKPKNNEVTVI